MVAKLNISTEVVSRGTGVVFLTGFLDSHTGRELEAVLESALREKIYNLLIDLSKLDYMSSAGIGIFVSTLGKLRRKRGRMIFVEPGKPVKDVFDVLGLTPLFKFVADVSEGLAILGKGTHEREKLL